MGGGSGQSSGSARLQIDGLMAICMKINIAWTQHQYIYHDIVRLVNPKKSTILGEQARMF